MFLLCVFFRKNWIRLVLIMHKKSQHRNQFKLINKQYSLFGMWLKSGLNEFNSIQLNFLLRLQLKHLIVNVLLVRNLQITNVAYNNDYYCSKRLMSRNNKKLAVGRKLAPLLPYAT